MKPTFDHERLHAYQKAIVFVAWVHEKVGGQRVSGACLAQLDRASTSIPLNIAEGNGKYTPRDRCRYLDIARGSSLECVACLDVLLAKGSIEADVAQEGKAILTEVVSLITGLIRSLSDRTHEEAAAYGRHCETELAL